MAARIRFLTIALVSMLILPASLSGASGQTPGPVLDVADVRVLDQRSIEVAVYTVGLSPDGRWLTVVSGREICVHDATTLSPHHCAEIENAVGLDGFSWSPDGTRIAFTENSPRHFTDSDLWVFEVDGGTLTNVTDDGYRGALPDLGIGSSGDAPSPLLVDTTPAWTPDGQALAFARTTWTEEAEGRQTSIYRIVVGHGEPELLVTFPVAQAFLVSHVMRWTPDGEQLLFTIDTAERNNPANGIWSVNANGGSMRQVAGETDPELGYPILVDVSARGQALVVYREPIGQAFSHFEITHALVDITSGQHFPLTVAGEDPRDSSITGAGFSPDGDLLLYGATPFLGPAPERLMLRNLVTGEERIVAEEIRAVPIWPTHALSWARNGVVYLPDDPARGTLLTLGVSEETNNATLVSSH